MRDGTNANGVDEQADAGVEDVRVCLICPNHTVAEILARALTRELECEADTYSTCEDALCSDLDQNVFVVYDYFGRDRMNGPQGVKRLRLVSPKAYILGVTNNPGFDKQFVKAGADTAMVLRERPIKAIVHMVRKRVVTTLVPEAARRIEQ